MLAVKESEVKEYSFPLHMSELRWKKGGNQRTFTKWQNKLNVHKNKTQFLLAMIKNNLKHMVQI